MTLVCQTAERPKLSNGSTSWVDVLAKRAWRLASVVEGISRRRDVRELRAKLLLLLLEKRCPLDRDGYESWYVRGAVARCGAEGLRRFWGWLYGEEPPALSTVRKHLSDLASACLIVRAPGDWIPVMHPEQDPRHRPRYPDTFHVVDTDEEAKWWANVGLQRLENNRSLSFNPGEWRKAFGHWRAEAKRGSDVTRKLPFPPARTVEFLPEHKQELAEQRGHAIAAAAVTTPANPAHLLSVLDRCGARIEGRPRLSLARHPERFRSVCAMLAQALLERQRLRNLAGWIVRVYNQAKDEELQEGLEWVASHRWDPPS